MLGYLLDSGAYPDALGKRNASVGSVVTGFQGLLRILETNLGLLRPEVPEIRRIAAWEEIIRTVGVDQFAFAKSFRVDSWNTSKELLRRRDELVLAGWDPAVHQGGGRLLTSLAKLELQSPSRLFGFADRVRAVLHRLQEPALLNLEEIVVVDEDETLWEPWCANVMEAVRRQGVTIRNCPPTAQLGGGEETDLMRLQGVLAGTSGPVEAQGDGTVLLVKSETEWDAADYLVSWLEANGSDESLVIRESGSMLLDAMFHQRGLPAVGAYRPSKWRSALQVLPLTLETYWEPLRLEPLLQLLTLPVSPIPARIRYRLAAALANAPGIGGPPWNEAITKGYERCNEEWLADGLDEKETHKRQKRIKESLDTFVNHDTYSPTEGMPLSVLLEICTKVGQWAASTQETDDAVYGVVVEQSEMVTQAAKALGVDRIERLQMIRILSSVVGDGIRLPDFGEEATAWPIVNHPGQIFEPVDTIVWWGFTGRLSGGNTTVWSLQERGWLDEQGVHLADESLSRRREAAFWKRAIAMAKDKLILVAPQKMDGEVVPVHPLWDEICHAVARTTEAKRRIVFDASLLRKEDKHDLAGRRVKRERLPERALPQPIRAWQATKHALSPRAKESATSLDTLLGCPLYWTLRYPAKISSGRALSLPAEPIMLGTLAHEVLRSLLEESKRWDPNQARVRAGELFDSLVRLFAAPLLEPQNGVQRQETKSLLQSSVRHFFQTINDAGIEILETEHELTKNWKPGIDIEGRLDIIAQTRSKTPMVIDAKWSRNPKGYRQRLEGLSTQLTLYHWLLARNDQEELPVAYFMLRTGNLFAHPHQDLPQDSYVEGPSLPECQVVLRNALEEEWRMLDEGRIVAAGIPSDAELDERSTLVEPPCRYCEYKNLCGQSGEMMA